jgi:hypothetical protein
MAPCSFGYYSDAQTTCDAFNRVCDTTLICVKYTTFGFIAETLGLAFLISLGFGGLCAIGYWSDRLSMIPKNEQSPYYDMFILIVLTTGLWVVLNLWWWFLP